MSDDSCQNLLKSLSDYLDGAASAELCSRIEGHLASCEKCRVVMNTMRKTMGLYRSLPRPTLSEKARARLYESLNLADHLRRSS